MYLGLYFRFDIFKKNHNQLKALWILFKNPKYEVQRDMELGNTTSTGTIKKSGSPVAEVAQWVC